MWAALPFLIPFFVAMSYQEVTWPFSIAAVLVFGCGWLLKFAARNSEEIRFREGFIVVALTWLLISAFGSIPYLVLGTLGPLDAFFESISGFTTTGATVLQDIESQSRSILIWRSLTQWLGGMGIIVLVIAILPRLAIGGRQLIEMELPGPTMQKLTPRITHTARQLWSIYVLLTVIEGILLWISGLSPFDSISHALTTMPTGGFGTQNDSVASFPIISQWIVLTFMFVAGLNFVLLYKSIRGDLRSIREDHEIRLYIAVIAIATLVLCVDLSGIILNLEELLRTGLFQVISMVTTTGFASADFATWDDTTKLILVTLMFFGGSAGSTAGSMKMLRTLIIFKLIYREIRRLIHPRAVIPLRLGSRVIDEDSIRGIVVFGIIYVSLFAFGSLLMMEDMERTGGIAGQPLHIFEAISATASALGNVGPALGVFGPMENYAALPAPSKMLLMLLMWAGRLEILPVIVLFTKAYWVRS